MQLLYSLKILSLSLKCSRTSLIFTFLIHPISLMSTARPDRETRRAPKPSAKVTDSANIGKLELKFHQHARDIAISVTNETKNTSTSATATSTSSKRKQATFEDVDDEDSNSAPKCNVLLSLKYPPLIFLGSVDLKKVSGHSLR